MSIRNKFREDFFKHLNPTRYPIFEKLLTTLDVSKLITFQNGKDNVIAKVFDFYIRHLTMGNGRSYVVDTDYHYLECMRKDCSYQCIYLEGPTLDLILNLTQDRNQPPFDLIFLAPEHDSNPQKVAMNFYQQWLLLQAKTHQKTIFLIPHWSKVSMFMNTELIEKEAYYQIEHVSNADFMILSKQ